jgi:hypothetical protein
VGLVDEFDVACASLLAGCMTGTVAPCERPTMLGQLRRRFRELRRSHTSEVASVAEPCSQPLLADWALECLVRLIAEGQRREADAAIELVALIVDLMLRAGLYDGVRHDAILDKVTGERARRMVRISAMSMLRWLAEDATAGRSVAGSSAKACSLLAVIYRCGPTDADLRRVIRWCETIRRHARDAP